MKGHQTQLLVPNDPAYLRLIGDYVAFISRRMGFPEGEVARIRLAVDEACMNVLHHAYGRDQRAHFSISCAEEEDHLRIVIWDGGPAFDLSHVPRPNLEAPLEKRNIGGLGLYLMRQVMDEVRLEEQTEGKALILRKRVPPAS